MSQLRTSLPAAGYLASLIPLAISILAAQAAPSAPNPSRRALPAAGHASPVVALRVEPDAVQLVGPRASARPIVLAGFADGSLRDVSADAAAVPSDSKLIRVTRDGALLPLKDGATSVSFTWQGRTATVKAVVKNAATRTAISFNNEIVPILTRAGCNQGACHGAQYGKGGFKLSLAGFDTDLDYLNIVKQGKGRRVASADPERSLLLEKPAMAVPHGGGRRLEPGSADYKLLAQWIREGAPGPSAADPQVVKIDIFPTERVMERGGTPQRLYVRATYSDNTTRDVTAQTRLNTLNDAVAACTPAGVVTPVNKGQTAIMARYCGQATVATIMVPFERISGLPPTTARVGAAPARTLRLATPSARKLAGEGANTAFAGVSSFQVSGANEPRKGTVVSGQRSVNAMARAGISSPSLRGTSEPGKGVGGLGGPSGKLDALVARKQAQLRLAPSPLCDDATFIRRVSLDLIGTTPTPAEVQAFLQDRSPNKRAKLIDALLERPEYADFWTLKWGDLLRSNRTNLGSAKGMWSFTNWIRTQLQQNRPADAFVRDLIEARGSTYTDGPANYYRVAQNPQDLAETTSQVFLGVRLQCAKCHHHPFEKWSQSDYYSFAAFFARVGIKGSDEFGIFGGEQVIRVNNGGEVYHPKTGALMHPAPLGVKLAALPDGKLPDPDADGDRRKILAEWLVGKNDRLFARNIANRYWAYLFGKGIYNPIDDQRVTNPPTNPALLDALADGFMQSGYDLKHLLRIICNSRTYQRSAQATPQNIQDEFFFTHYPAKRLSAESLLDAIDFACGTQEKYPDLPLGMHAIQLPDPAVGSEFLDTFGRPQRLIACECERVAEPNLSQALRLMNGDLVNRKISDGNGRIAKMTAAKKSDGAILDELYRVTLCRPPTARERMTVLGVLAFSKDRRPVFEDVLLTLLNSKEFLFNH